MEILHNISELLKDQGKSQKQLTDHLGLKQNAYTNWKGGYSQSYKKYLPQIADFLGVSVDRLTGSENTEKDADRRKDLDRIHKLTDADLKRIIAMGELSGIIPKEETP